MGLLLDCVMKTEERNHQIDTVFFFIKLMITFGFPTVDQTTELECNQYWIFTLIVVLYISFIYIICCRPVLAITSANGYPRVPRVKGLLTETLAALSRLYRHSLRGLN